MEILIRLFLWILNRTFGRQNAASLYGSNPMDEKLLLDLEESRQLEREAQLQTQIVENFKSTASAVHASRTVATYVAARTLRPLLPPGHQHPRSLHRTRQDPPRRRRRGFVDPVGTFAVSTVCG